MASPIRVQLILADAAQAVGGKVSMLGAGWSITGSPTPPSAVVALIKVPWDLANEQLDVHLRLLTEDGQPVLLSDPLGQEAQPVEFMARLEVGRPAGLKHGSAIDASFAIPVPSLPLAPGRYEWRLDLNADTVAADFQVIPVMGNPPQ